MYFIYRVGQIIGGMLCNVLAYADDIVLLAPMWRGLQHLISVLERHSIGVSKVTRKKRLMCPTMTSVTSQTQQRNGIMESSA